MKKKERNRYEEVEERRRRRSFVRAVLMLEEHRIASQSEPTIKKAQPFIISYSDDSPLLS